MDFDEWTHASIIGFFFSALQNTYGQKGEKIFEIAARGYGFRRGERMALAAVCGGWQRNYASYVKLGDRIPSRRLQAFYGPNRVRTTAFQPDHVVEVRACPWHDQFLSMGLKKAGQIYCSQIDTAMYHGFNPEIRFQVSQTLYTADCCRFVIEKQNISETEDLSKVSPFRTDMSFHCRELFEIFSKIIRGAIGSQSERVIKNVLLNLETMYGTEMTEMLFQARRDI